MVVGRSEKREGRNWCFGGWGIRRCAVKSAANFLGGRRKMQRDKKMTFGTFTRH